MRISRLFRAAVCAVLMITCLITCSCSERIVLDYAESFAVSAFRQIDGNKGCTLSEGMYAYTDREALEAAADGLENCTERQRDFYYDIYCCVQLTIIKDGKPDVYTRYFSISGYDLTEELDGVAALDKLKASLKFERYDLTRLTRFI